MKKEILKITELRFNRVKDKAMRIIKDEGINKQDYLKVQLDEIEKAKEEGYNFKIHNNKLLIMFLQEIILRLAKNTDDIKYYKLEIDKMKDEMSSEFK